MRRKGWSVLVLFALVVLLLTSIAPALAEEVTITGTVESLEGSIVIQTQDGDYVITGQDLSEMVGKKVKATGSVTDNDGIKTLEVGAVEEVKG